MYAADSNANHVGAGFEQLEFFVVQDIFFSSTCRYADVVLPASPSLEKEGTFTNTERRIQRLYQVFQPLGDSRPDWRITRDLANRMGANWTYQHPSDVMHESASLAPLFAGVHYDRLEGYRSLQWPVAADGTDAPFLYADRFAFPDGKARLYPTTWVPPLEPEGEFDLVVNNGRLLEHFHWRNLTGETAGLEARVPNMFVEVSPELALEKGIRDGDLVRVVSSTGAIRTRAWVTDRVRGRSLFIPEHGRDEDAINHLTTDARDSVAHTPAYKEVPARLEKIASGSEPEPPVPRSNFRRGTPDAPQKGIRVEQKWQRADYHAIGG